MEELDEEDVDFELNEKEAPFLLNQTSKAGIPQSPIWVSLIPDGSLTWSAMNQARKARERKEIKEEQKRELIKNLPDEMKEILNEPKETDQSIP